MLRFCVVAAVLALCLGVAPAVASGAPGDLDPDFGDGGVFSSPHQTVFSRAALDQDSLGRPLVAWTFNAGNPTDFADLKLVVARLTDTGSLDPTFNPGGAPAGVVVVDFPERPGVNVQASAVAAGPGGTVVALGTMAPATFSQEIALVRLTGAGAYDDSFSGDGRLVTKVSESYDFAADLAIDASGNSLVAGLGAAGCPPVPCETFPVLSRFTSGGALDMGFDGDGHVEPTGTATLGQLNDVDALPGGGAIVAGYTFPLRQQALVARFNSAGALDGSFSGDGLATPGLGEGNAAGSAAGANGVHVDGAGRLLVVGGAHRGDDDSNNFAVARLTSAGDPDIGWGTGVPQTGVVHLPTPRAISGFDAAQLPDGKVMATGNGRRFNQNNAIVLARLTETGALDTTFAPAEPTPGLLQTQLSDSSMAFQLVRPPGGGTLVSGARTNGSGSDSKAVVLRYLDDGEPDPDQDGDGVSDNSDNCPNDPNPNQENNDGDNQGDACDLDDDNDGTADVDDDFPFDPDEQQDTDDDSHGDNSDNCPNDPNPNQENNDGDNQGDACDTSPGGGGGGGGGGGSGSGGGGQPPPPPGQPPQNTRLPTIEPAGSGNYRCRPGSWQGATARTQKSRMLRTSQLQQASFDFSWVRMNGGQAQLVSQAPTYNPPGLDLSRYLCQVEARNSSGTNLAVSEGALLTGQVVDVGFPYGDFRIRGIDVAQVVQPLPGAQMFRWPVGGFTNLPGGAHPPVSASTRAGTSGPNLPSGPDMKGSRSMPPSRPRRSSTST